MSKIKSITIDWEFYKERLKEKYPSLTDIDLHFEQGKLELMLSKLQEKLGKTRHQIYRIFSHLKF